MTLKTRKPTGKAAWPIILLAGREGAGKSWSAAAASGSDLIGRTFWIGIGEDDPDEYALIPGARFEIVEHDGTFRDILRAVRDVVEEPTEGKPNLLVIDSMTRLWNLMGDNAQGRANGRRKGNSNTEATITVDLWNDAGKQWASVMDLVRGHHGPSILTARLDQVTVIEDGKPTGDKQWKIQGHKSLPYDVGVIVEMPERGQYRITKAKSARVALAEPRTFPGFTVDQMWRDLGVGDGAMADRSHAGVQIDESDPEKLVEQWRSRALKNKTRDGVTAIWKEAVPLVKNGSLPQAVLDALTTIAADIRSDESTTPPLAGQGSAAPARPWLRDARAIQTRAAMRGHYQEAQAGGASAEVLSAIEQLESSLPEEEKPADEAWAPAEGVAETKPDGWTVASIPEPETVDSQAAALAEEPF